MAILSSNIILPLRAVIFRIVLKITAIRSVFTVVAYYYL